MFLSHDEVEKLTGKVRPSAQIRQLRFMGIPYRTRINGTPLVMESDLSADTPPKRPGPNLDALESMK